MYAAMQEATPETRERLALIEYVDPDLRVAVIEKIDALNSNFNMSSVYPDRSKRSFGEFEEFVQDRRGDIESDIRTAVLGLADLDVSQGDTRMDNVGIKNGKFALFDYNAAGPADVERDKKTFMGSLDTYSHKRDDPSSEDEYYEDQYYDDEYYEDQYYDDEYYDDEYYDDEYDKYDDYRKKYEQ
jgi:hypothetical protein